MTFYVGQKVVCVDAGDEHNLHWGDSDVPVVGSIYTVYSSHVGPYGAPVLWLEEISRSDAARRQHGYIVGYGVHRFHPVQERKHDLSIFYAMLNPANQTVGA